LNSFHITAEIQTTTTDIGDKAIPSEDNRTSLRHTGTVLQMAWQLAYKKLTGFQTI